MNEIQVIIYKMVTQDDPWVTMDDPWVTMDDPWVTQDDPWVTQEDDLDTVCVRHTFCVRHTLESRTVGDLQHFPLDHVESEHLVIHLLWMLPNK